MIICAGSIFADYISKIDKFPKKPIKVLSSGIDRRLGGSAAVSAFTAKKLGFNSKFIGKFGDDDSSIFLRNEFKKFSINIDKSIIIKNCQSSQSFVIEDKKGERLLAAYNDPKLLKYKKLPTLEFRKKDIYSIDMRWISVATKIAISAKEKNIKCVADLDNFKNSSSISKIIKNASHPIFSEEGLKTYKKNKNFESALFQIFNETKKFVAVTMGSRGVYWVENNSLYHCKVPKVKTVETNCAGDVFHGAFASALSQHKSNSESILFAAATATLKCMKTGGIYSIPKMNIVNRFIKKLKIKKIR